MYLVCRGIYLEERVCVSGSIIDQVGVILVNVGLSIYLIGVSDSLE